MIESDVCNTTALAYKYVLVILYHRLPSRLSFRFIFSLSLCLGLCVYVFDQVLFHLCCRHCCCYCYCCVGIFEYKFDWCTQIDKYNTGNRNLYFICRAAYLSKWEMVYVFIWRKESGRKEERMKKRKKKKLDISIYSQSIQNRQLTLFHIHKYRRNGINVK